MTGHVFCKDCKYRKRDWFDKLMFLFYYKCYHEKSYRGGRLDLETGKLLGGFYSSCGLARMEHGFCGTEGQFWEPKNTKKFIFTVLKRG